MQPPAHCCHALRQQLRSAGMALRDLIPTLQVAIGPVILISGVGLLLLTMTNRFGRIIDRTRQIAIALRSSETQNARAAAQLEILLLRARIVRGAIFFASLSVLLAAILVITLFLAVLFDVPVAAPIVILFAGSMGCLIVSLMLFLRDINLSLHALRLEVGDGAIGATSSLFCRTCILPRCGGGVAPILAPSFALSGAMSRSYSDDFNGLSSRK
jgi:Protein of unknown function (DUF2721)